MFGTIGIFGNNWCVCQIQANTFSDAKLYTALLKNLQRKGRQRTSVAQIAKLGDFNLYKLGQKTNTVNGLSILQSES